MSKLIRWETPFTDSEWPSAELFFSSYGDGRVRISAAVCPSGIDKYPKYVVDFGEALAFTSFEEALAPEIHTFPAEVEGSWKCACEWVDSPWAESYAVMWNVGKADPLRHYLIFGGDNNLEILTHTIPSFETVEQPRTVAASYLL